jgi:hypothetical protein
MESRFALVLTPHPQLAARGPSTVIPDPVTLALHSRLRGNERSVDKRDRL